MLNKIVIFFLTLGALNFVSATSIDNGAISGYIFDKTNNEPLPGVNIVVKGTLLGAVSDQNGNFKIEHIPVGQYQIIAQMIGYQSVEEEVHLKTNQIVYLEIGLKPEILKGEAIVVTGTRMPRYLKDSPIKTDVVTIEEINRINPSNFLEATQSIIGVDPSIECSICNASTISLQGLPGRYTQVLIDGIPLFSSLGQTYGYLELPANLIDQLEIIKGANSVLYGSDAIAGIINIRTVEPSFVPKMNFETQLGQYGQKKITGSASFKPGNVGVLISGEFYNIKPVDRDQDGLTEFAGNTRSFLNGKMSFQLSKKTQLKIRINGLSEERQGGAIAESRSFIETIDSLTFRNFTESILSKRFDVVSEFKHNFSLKNELIVKSGYTTLFQDSDYEGFVYVATQNLTFNEIQFNRKFSTKLNLTTGLAYRTEDLNENTAIHPYHYKTTSLFSQLDYSPTSSTEIVGGLRFDHHNIYGMIFTPSFILKNSINSLWTVRLSYGEGFKAPTTFYELDHGTGAKYKYHTKYLAKKAESSKSINLSLDFTRQNQNLSFSLFYHRINNYINAYNDYITQSFVVKNIEQPSSFYGLELNYNNVFFNKLYLTLGYIFERYQLADGVLGHARPEQKFKWLLNFDDVFRNTSINLNGQLTGPMKLREVYGIALNKDGSTKLKNSPPFLVINGEISYSVNNSVRFALGAKNLFDFQQNDIESPLIYDESGALTDVIYIWGPLLGRTIYARCSISIE